MRVKYIFSSRKTGSARAPVIKNRDPFPKVVKEMIETCDVILEVLDARFIDQTRNIALENLILEKNKKIVYVLNKCDLIDIRKIMENYELDKLNPHVFVSSKDRVGRKKLIERIKIEVKRLKLTQRARVGVIGYPNTGKSSIINFLTARSSARTAAESGFTKGIQRIRLTPNIHILDTPGVIPDNEDSSRISKDLTKHTMISVRTYDKVKNPDFVIHGLMQEYPGLLEKYYSVEANGDSEALLEVLGRKKHWMTKGDIVDLDKTARFILRDWQEGKIRIK
jgi:ribosome biogenesis GTPase A